jgi:hypothetical protein
VTRPPLPFAELAPEVVASPYNFLIQHSSRVLADGGNVFLRKPIRARVFASTPVHLAGRGDGTWETTTAFRSRRRLPATARARPHVARRKSVEGEMVGGIVVPVGAAPIARNRKSARRADGKFSALQSVENPQNAERISIFCEPFPQAGIAAPTRRARLRVGRAHGPSVVDLPARRSGQEMAPQRLEKIESAPGNGRVSEASNPQYLVPGARLTRRSLAPIQPLAKVVGGLGRDRWSTLAALPRRGKFSALQSLEKSRNGKIIPISLERSAASAYPSTPAASTTRNCARSRPP